MRALAQPLAEEIPWPGVTDVSDWREAALNAYRVGNYALGDACLDAENYKDAGVSVQEGPPSGSLASRMKIPQGQPGHMRIFAVDREQSLRPDSIHPLSTEPGGMYIMAHEKAVNRVFIYSNVHFPNAYLRRCRENDPRGVFMCFTHEEYQEVLHRRQARAV